MADPISLMALGSAAASGATATGAALATTTAGAATAGLFGTAGTFSLGATLSTLGTAGSLFGTMMGGSAQNAQAEYQAKQAEFAARQEEVRGKQEANSIRSDIARALASSNARGAASGISISSGSPVTAQKEALRDADSALSTAGTNAKLRAEQQRVQAQLYRQQGRNATRQTGLKAASILGNFAVDQQDRGVFSF